MGKHTREDLPRLLESVRASHPQIAFELRPALGEEQRVIELIADIAVS
jgi:sirohydrochlorin cobaltochelatase